MAVLTSIGVALAQWLIGLVAGEISTEFNLLVAKWKSGKALKDNQTALQGAIQTGDVNAEEKAGESSLDNTNG